VRWYLTLAWKTLSHWHAGNICMRERMVLLTTNQHSVCRDNLVDFEESRLTGAPHPRVGHAFVMSSTYY
jgi:hypothetical protein